MEEDNSIPTRTIGTKRKKEEEWDSDAEKDLTLESTSSTASPHKQPPSFMSDADAKKALQKAQELVHTAGFFSRGGAFTRKQATSISKNFMVKQGLPKQLGWRMPIFAEDLPPRPGYVGPKRFLITSYDTLFDYYKNELTKEQRYHYEVIDKKKPCNLYVDMEFEYEHNPSFDKTKAEQLELEFRVFLIHGLLQEHAARKEEDIDIFVSDASNDKKFSRHYVVHIKNRSFVNNFHCGAFMRRLCNRAIREHGPEHKNRFFVRTAKTDLKTKEEIIVYGFLADLAVYTKYRMFRLLWSSKRKLPFEFRPLLPLSQTLTTIVIDKRTFMSSLIQHVYPDDALIEMKEPDGSDPKSTNDNHRFRTDKQLSDCLDKTLAHLELRASVASSPSIRYDALLGRNVQSVDLSARKIREEDVKDFLPHVCDCIRAEWGDTNINFKLSTYSSEYSKITLLSNSYLCRLKGAAHKSNHVSFDIFLATHTFSQFCFNQDFPCQHKYDRKEKMDLLPEEIRNRLMKERKGYKITDKKTTEAMDNFLRQRNDGLTPEERMTQAQELARMCGFYVNVPLQERSSRVQLLDTLPYNDN